MSVTGNVEVTDCQRAVQGLELIEASGLIGGKHQVDDFAVQLEAHVIFIRGLINAQGHGTVSDHAIDTHHTYTTGNIAGLTNRASGAVVLRQEECGAVG